MTVTEARDNLDRLRAVGDPHYIAEQVRIEEARVSRLVSTLDMDPDGSLWLRTTDPLDDEADADVRCLGPIDAPRVWRLVPPDLWDQHEALEREWREAGEQREADLAGLRADYRSQQGF